MDAMEAILSRRSIRKYTDEPVSDEDIEKLLRAAMSAPTAGNQQAWEFVVINDRKILEDIPKYHPFSQMLKHAPVAILVCADLERETKVGYWPQDSAAATQNILIAANAMGLGAVWLGIHPREERVKGVRKILCLPDNIVPVSLVSIGQPAEKLPPADRYDKGKVHYNGF